MRTEQINIYEFSELSESAKENARNQFRYDEFDSSQFEASANEFAQIAPIQITEWDCERATVGFKWTGDSDIAKLEGLRAWKWLQNNGWFEWAKSAVNGDCPLTGVFSDSYFGDGIFEYADKPLRTPSLEQVFYEAAQAWIQGMRSDCEWRNSDEYLDEMIEANEYEFTSDGKLY